MNLDVARILAIAGVIATSLVTAILALYKWIRSLVKQRNERDAAQIAKLEEDLEATTEKLDGERAGRLKDSRDYANGVIALSHRFREAVMALVNPTWRK